MISVLICVYNGEKYIRRCIKSLLDQTVQDFELIIVDDGSTDNTRKIIEEFNDKRIIYFRNTRNMGIAKSRNRCIKLSNPKTEYLFFTDDDCIVLNDWIEQGLIYLKEKGYDGVEGKIYYISEDYKPTYSDGTYIRQNLKGGSYMTGNIAYKKSIIKKVDGFDEKYVYLNDRDIALRIIQAGGRICFNPKMIVYHQKITIKPMEFVKTGKQIRDRVLLFKKFRDRPLILWRIVYPKNLLGIIFPPLVFLSFFRNRYKTKEDYVLFPFIYIRLIYQRLNLWYMCIKERVLLI